MTDDHVKDDPNEDLRARLAALDPMADRPVTPLTAETKEHAMTTEPTTGSTTERTERRAVLLTMTACLAVVGSAVAVALVFDGGDKSEDVQAGKKTVLELKNAPGVSMGMCIPTSPETLRVAAHAFEGTATSVEGGVTSFDVTHWYKGGDEQVVTLSSEGPDTVEDGIAFEEGKTYLVAAGETEVGPCSGSGESSPAAKAMFEDAFGG